MHVFGVARADGVVYFSRRRARFASRAWGRRHRRALRRSFATVAKRRFLCGRPAGRVTEMLGNERLGAQGQQEMTKDMRLCAPRVVAWRACEAHAAFEMLEGNFDAPSQPIESADRSERVFVAIERCDEDDPFSREQRLGHQFATHVAAE